MASLVSREDPLHTESLEVDRMLYYQKSKYVLLILGMIDITIFTGVVFVFFSYILQIYLHIYTIIIVLFSFTFSCQT